jgi:PhnB protein
MPTRLNPYLSFRDNAREAMEFYRSVFGGELVMNTFDEFQASSDPAEKDKIMHAQLESPSGFTLMASDTPSVMEYRDGSNGSISLSGDQEAELRGYWDKLSDGGTPIMPLDKQVWGDTFGMLADKFGITWMVNIAGAGR